MDGIITSWNKGAERIYGYSAHEMVGLNIALLDPPAQLDDTRLLLERIRNGEPVIRYETVRRKKDGGLINISLTASQIRNTQNILIGVSTIAHDITTRKQAEAALNATETRYRRLFETAQDGILILDADTGQIVEVNPFLIAFLGFSREQFLGKKIWEIGLFKDIVANKENFEELQRKESIRYENLPLETADGRNIAVEFVSNVYMVNDKKVIQCNIRDITERKKMTEQIEASLAEKVTLVKEVHHRVKNNLQIIASLLNMQIRKTTDPQTIEALKDSQNRVRSMAIVHEQLYKGKDSAHIDLGNYIRSLGTVIFSSYETGNRGVRFDPDIHDIYVDTNTAIPLGLISNELITNSLKYAFKERKDGRLSITATEDPAALTFIVADNGVGMSPEITLENQPSLGLKLVSTLTDQLNGTVTIDRTGGTRFTFTFPKPTEHKPVGGSAE
jgi:PAS domain S-box-containing protein